MIEEKEDFFEQTPDDEPVKEKKIKSPSYGSEDPRYYEKEEGRWEHITPAPYRRGPLLWLLAGLMVVVAVLVWGYVYFFTPKIDEAVQYGYVEDIHREGFMFDTFEGVILPYKTLKDTTRLYRGDFKFTAKNDSVAAILRYREGQGLPVRVEYKMYRVALPWRGNSRIVVTNVDTAVNPRTILPPEFRPEHP